MLMDIEGRIDTAVRGKGRWTQTKCNNPGNTLAFSELGLAPSTSHQGVQAKTAVGDHAKKHVQAPKEPEPRRTGKKSIHMEHASDDPEAIKRASGRYGIKKVQAPAPTTVRERQRANAKPSQTSEERAAATLKKAIAADPALSAKFAPAFERGGLALIEAEREVKRRQECQARAEYQAAARAAAKPRRFADPENLAHIEAPFGTNVAGKSNTTTYRPYRRQLDTPRRDEATRFGKRQVPEAAGSSSRSADTPFDTADSGAPYPAPPPCGVRVPLGTKHAKRVIDAPTNGRDYDTEQLERSARRASRDTGAPDFIFGSPAGDKLRKAPSPARYQPVGLSMLEHNTKAPPPPPPRSRFADVKYKKTALW